MVDIIQEHLNFHNVTEHFKDFVRLAKFEKWKKKSRVKLPSLVAISPQGRKHKHLLEKGSLTYVETKTYSMIIQEKHHC